MIFLVLSFGKSSEIFCPRFSFGHENFKAGKLFLKSLKFQIEILLDFLWHIVRRSVLFKNRKILISSSFSFALKSDSFFLISNDNIFTGMFLFLAGIVFFLLLLVFQSLNGTLSFVNENLSRLWKSFEKLFELSQFPFRKNQLST